jgi:DNA-binding transcriptional MerR regulator
MGPVHLPQKLYFRIGEVARLLEVKPHVIRFWEKEFKSLRPKKSAAGQRIFSRKDVERLVAIKHLLYEQGFTIDGARKHLREKGFEPDTAREEEVARVDHMRERLVAARSRLTALLAALDAAR